MRILVTGADGMLGSNLVRLLLERGHEVSVFINHASSSKTLEGLKITRHIGCIQDPATITPAVKGNNVIIHAAAATSLWPARSEKVRKINVEGTRNILNAAVQEKVERFIFIGSASSIHQDKDSKSNLAFPGAKYGLDYIDSKYNALNLVLDAVKKEGLPALAILPTYMIGSYDSLPGSGKMIQAIALGKLKFYTKGGRNFSNAKDVAVAIANALEFGEVGKCYIAGNENLTYHEFFSKVSKIVGKPAPGICVPNWMVKVIGRISELACETFNLTPLLSYPMARVSCDKQFVSSELAVNELKMPQSKIETGIHECYEWFIQNGYVTKK